MYRIVATFFAALVCAGAARSASAQEMPPGAPPPAAASAASPNPAMLAQAKRWFAQLQAGKIDRSRLATSASGALSDARIAQAQSVIGHLGAPVGFVQQQAGSRGGVSYAIYLVTFKNGERIDFLFAVDRDGKVASLGLGAPR